MSSEFGILCCIGLIMLVYYSIRVTELAIRNEELKERIDKAMEYIENVYNSLENVDRPILFYEKILEILKGSDKE